MKYKLLTISLISLIVSNTYSQDTIVLTNGNLFVGKIVNSNQKDLVIEHITSKGELKPETIKIARIGYCSNLSIRYSTQPVTDAGGNMYYINHKNIQILARQEILNPKSSVSKELLPLHFMDILPVESGRVVYTEVIAVENTNKNELYRRARLWATNAFKSANDVVQLDDPGNGTIVCRGNTSIIHGFVAIKQEPVTVNFRASVFVKDGRYKYEVTDITLRYNSGSNIWRTEPVEYWFNSSRESNTKKLYESVDNAIIGLIYTIKMGMTIQSQSDKDW